MDHLEGLDDMVDYRAAHQVASAMFRGLTPDQLATPCPQCPGWTVRDVVCHHVHIFIADVDGEWTDEILADVQAAAVEPDPGAKAAAAQRRDAWIQRGVDALSNQPFDEVLSHWDDAVRRGEGDAGFNVTDLAVHLGDVGEALDAPRPDDAELNAAALERYGSFLTEHLLGRGVATVRLEGTDPAVVCGDLRSPHVITGSTYELLRVVTGRRSRAEADRLIDWGTTPEETRLIFPIYDWLEHGLLPVDAT